MRKYHPACAKARTARIQHDDYMTRKGCAVPKVDKCRWCAVNPGRARFGGHCSPHCRDQHARAEAMIDHEREAQRDDNPGAMLSNRRFPCYGDKYALHVAVV